MRVPRWRQLIDSVQLHRWILLSDWKFSNDRLSDFGVLRCGINADLCQLHSWQVLFDDSTFGTDRILPSWVLLPNGLVICAAKSVLQYHVLPHSIVA
jgi:hypothetical protein